MAAPVQAAVLGVVQGLTEFLPVSSTAHLLIGERLLGFADPGSVFTEMIQFGSMLAVMWVYRAKIMDVAGGLPHRPDARRFATLLLVAIVPALLAGALFADYVEAVLHKSPPVIASAFVLGGLVMLAVERWRPRPTVGDMGDTSLRQAIGIGMAQMVALIPGVSRSGATIVGGMLAGLDRPAAAEFSFFLAMPTLGAAFLRNVYELRDHITADRLGDIGIGFVAAFIASVAVIHPFLAFVRRAGFAPFAWYRIVAGLAIFAAVAAGIL